MAARLQQLLARARSATEPMYNTARSQAIKQYDALMTSNQQYVVKDKEVADKLLKQWFFTQLARLASYRA
jgi:F-type H+-transporting ATPase subunit g